MPQYLDIEQSFFIWYTADKGYYSDNQAKPAEAFTSPEQRGIPAPFLLPNPETTHFIGSKLLEEEPNLFLRFAELTPDEKAILIFANQYGPLTRGEVFVTTPTYSFKKGKKRPWKHKLEFLHKQGNRSYGVVRGESLNFWLREMHDMSQAVQIWEWIQNKDIPALRRVLSEIIEFRKDDILSPAQRLVQSKTNEKLKHYNVQLRLMDNKNKLEPYLIPNNLISALWLQFSKFVTGEKRYKRCPVCLLWADVTDKTKRWKKHPECANRERVARFREKNPN